MEMLNFMNHLHNELILFHQYTFGKQTPIDWDTRQKQWTEFIEFEMASF